ncbi:head-tail connector protein [Bradyrhizobium sp. AUGA SZCCT0160]|uniref:head-tail connector protein n=1 Tax=Bradyrhizobium sp. AUGA SZCCT0160 TaxID=2807662 RepID=UPI001BACD1CC|nr:head-tail connector protein [Bradyrhizobium sp. AUGA SZCCT0160]MBR1193233.1 phage gp6-like head-tail connector protein [Bradyrhizobium sp. AUGA SZCCT0160]
MPVVVIDAPVGDLVSLDEAKKHLRVDFDDDDEYIEALIDSAVAHIDGPAGWLGRALLTQTLEWRGDEFGTCDIRLPFPPVADLVSVKYDDDDGVEQTAPDTIYRLVGQPGAPRVTLAYDETWPTVRAQSEAVRIQYTAGYGNPEDVPAPIKHAILLLIGHWYANREPVNIGNIVTEIPMTVRALLFPFQILA